MSSRVIFLLILVLACCGGMAAAQCDGIPLQDCDNQGVVIKTLPDQVLEDYRADPAFQYNQADPNNSSWWQAFVQWIMRTIGKIIDWIYSLLQSIFRPVADSLALSTSLVIKVVVYGAVVIIALVIIYMIMKGSFTAPTSAGKKTGPQFAITEEDLKSTDYDILITKAAEENQYRLAVRYMYLKLLQGLVKRKMIDWQAEKTNREYQYELPSGKAVEGFNRLTTVFEFIWYGEFFIDKHKFGKYQSEFNEFNRSSLR